MTNAKHITKIDAGHGEAMFAGVFSRPAVGEQRWYQANPDNTITESGDGAM